MSEIQTVTQQLTPADAIRQALTGTGNVAGLRELLELQERYEANEARKAYHRAMAQFKAEAPMIEKDKAVSHGVGKAAYKHATLANVVQTITPLLSKFGLSASWRVAQNGTINVTCRVAHILGHYEETTLMAPADDSGAKNKIQAIGSTITYLERYGLLAMLGLATSDQVDDDGQAAGAKVSDRDLHELRDLMAAANVTEAQLCKRYGCDTVDALSPEKLKAAKSALMATLAKAGGK